jgi:hypothetical protein
MNRKLLTNLLLLLSIPICNINAAPKKAAYSMNLQAMQDVNQTTDVYLTLSSDNEELLAADSAKHLQMKSFNEEGKLKWTKNEFDVPMNMNPSNPSSSVAQLSYTDMLRHQSVRAQVQVQNESTGRTQVIRTKTPVFLRPDLTISSVQASESVRVGEIMNISAVVEELNGDLGATAVISLSHGADLLDTAHNVLVNANGNASVVFSALFEDAGTYNLTVHIASSNPGDYDTSNNTKEFTVEVVDPVNVTSYYMSYWYTEQDYHYTWDSSYGSGTYSYLGEHQGFYDQIYMDGSEGLLEFPLQKASIQIAVDNQEPSIDLEITDLNADYTWTDNCYSGHSLWRDLGNGVYFYANSYNYCNDWKASYATVNQYANDYVYFSESHDYYWGDYSYNDVVKDGTFLRPEHSVQARLVVTSNDGTQYGGSSEITSLNSYSWDDIIDYNYGDYSQVGYNKGSQVNGYSNGTTTP